VHQCRLHQVNRRAPLERVRSGLWRSQCGETLPSTRALGCLEHEALDRRGVQVATAAAGREHRRVAACALAEAQQLAPDRQRQ
jgi:hypothetical protein